MNTEITGASLYLFAFVVVLFVSFIINTTFMSYLVVKYLNYITYLMVGLLLIKMVTFDHYRWWQLLILFGIFGLAVISWRKSKITSLMIMTAFVIAARNVNFHKIIHTYLWVNGMLLCMTFIYSLVGIITNLTYYRSRIPRFALGTDYPTDLAAYILYFVFAWVYIHYDSISKKDYLIIICGDILLFIVTNARLDSLMILVFLLMIWLTKKFENASGFIGSIPKTYWSFSIILPYAYFLLNYYYSDRFLILKRVDKFLSSRLALGQRGLKEYGITILGQHVSEHGWGGAKGLRLANHQPWKYFFIDSSYIRMLVILGSLLGVLVILTLVIISIRSVAKHQYLLPTIILMITISSLIDQHLAEITFNPFLTALFATNVISNTRRKNS